MKKEFDNVKGFLKNNLGQPPGTFSSERKGSLKSIKMEMISYDKDTFKIDKIDTIPENLYEKKVYWFNIDVLNDLENLKRITKRFSLDRIFLEDILDSSNLSQITKNELYIVSNTKFISINKNQMIREPITCVLKDNIILTFCNFDSKIEILENIKCRIKNNEGIVRSKKAPYLFYIIHDLIVDQYFSLFNNILKEYHEMEIEIVGEKFKDKKRIYNLRKELVYLSILAQENSI